MNKFISSAIAILSILVAGPSYGGTCIPVVGAITSIPDPTCQITQAVQTWPSSAEARDPLLYELNSGLPPESVCFKILGTGTAQFTGSSGLTLVGVVGSNGGTMTPLTFPPGVRSTLQGFTSQAVLNGTVTVGLTKKSGNVYTKDTGVIDLSDGKGNVGQVLKVVGGTAGFSGASGTLTVAGQEVGGLAVYSGKICLP